MLMPWSHPLLQRGVYMKNLAVYALMSILALAATGCSSKYMKPAGPDAASRYAPSSDKAAIIFIRPSSLGGAIQSSVFDVTTSDNVLVGIVSHKSKVAYRVAPGEHLFMVIGESADFMKADLEAGKTYYALVTPRIGVWKARFSLKPVHKHELTSDDFKDWNSSCEFVENTEASYQWAIDNMPSVQEKRTTYFEKWMNKPEADRPVLNREDGM